MGNTTCSLTVYFEDPFWIGVFERIDDGMLSAAKVTFGAEPKDYEVEEWILHNFTKLRFSPAVTADVRKRAVNPKRSQRLAREETRATGVGTKSMQALQLQREQFKQERKVVSRERKLAEEERLYELKQQKRKDKHRGH